MSQIVILRVPWRPSSHTASLVSLAELGSLALPLTPVGFRFEFDAANRILLLRVDGKITDELLGRCYEAIRQRSAATNARAGIFDFTSATEFPVSTEFVRRLAKQEPAMPQADVRPRVLVAPQIHAYGLVRMFQIMGEETRPLLHVVRTLDEALAALGVQSPDFEAIP